MLANLLCASCPVTFKQHLGKVSLGSGDGVEDPLGLGDGVEDPWGWVMGWRTPGVG